MNTPIPHLHFDFVDPRSWFVTQLIEADEALTPATIVWSGFETRPPPTTMVSRDDPALDDLWSEAHAIAAELEITLNPPPLVPWTRKAHELVLHAERSGLGPQLRRSIFEGYFMEGLDIGRVDVLVELARATGLDPTEAKAVLDVDRFQAEVIQRQAEAMQRGITQVPVLELGDARLTGFHNAAVLRTFLNT